MAKTISDLTKKLRLSKYKYVLITDIDKIKKYNDIMESKKKLPKNISKRETGLELIQDYNPSSTEDLPENIRRNNIVIHDSKTIKEIHNYYSEHREYPSNIGTRVKFIDGVNKTQLYYLDQYNYYKVQFDFFKKIPLNDEQLLIAIEAQKAVSLQEISSSLLFFKVLVILQLIIAGIMFLIYLIALL